MASMDLSPYVIWDTDPIAPDKEGVSLVGGKALGLHFLKSIGVLVPSWATLSTLFLRQLCKDDEELRELLVAQGQEMTAKAEGIRNHLNKFPVSDEGLEVLHAVWEKISENGHIPLAVRSSAADEDGIHFSFAGQMESFLNVHTFDQFTCAVRGCWASLFGDRAVFYRQKCGLECWSLQIAVVVQQMIEPEVSGVIFTANPLNGNRHEMLICSAWGLGEGLVSGALAADTFVLGAEGNCIRRELADKRQTVVCHEEGGTRSVGLNRDRQLQSTLNESDLRKLHGLALKVQEASGRPMDIEFAVCADRIYFLQSRPVTALEDFPPTEQDNYKVWDNSNIVESYAGITTPLTFSFIRKAYFAVYCQFCGMMGVNKKTVFKNRHVFENMLGFIQGRVYYNLLNWYRLIALMPGYKYNKSFMEQMMGLQVVGAFTPGGEPNGPIKKYLVHLPRLLWVGFKMLFNHFTLGKKISAFHANFDALYSRYDSSDFGKTSVSELMEVYRRLEDEVLWRWKAPILNDFEAMVFFGLLRKLTASWLPDAAAGLHNDLLCGEGGIKSTEVTTELFHLAAKIDSDQVLKNLFLEHPPEKICRLLQSDEVFSGIDKAFGVYLNKYGVRSIDEMKLESIPIKDDPTFCISVLQNYLRNGVPDPDKRLAQEREIRERAEEAVCEVLAGKKCCLFVPRTWIYRWVLKNTRKAVKNRENQRFARSQAYDLTRRILRAIGDKWKTAGILDDREDIFYLEIDEIWSYIEGTSTCPDLNGLIKLRKKVFARYRTETPDDHLETYGEVYRCSGFAQETGEIEMATRLEGLGCCRGVVEKEVRIVSKPDSKIRLDGEIMVARQTDPGWILLFPSIGGLIVEKGSLLSHSAIVAREMGIPTVVGVKDATKQLHDGDLVRLDGEQGVVTLLQRAGK